jgi:Tfp pilus assembly protein PilX
MRLSGKRENSGQTIVFALVLIVVMAILTPTLVNLLREEVRWSVKHKRSVGAFHLAEAAADRGLWKLSESSTVWESVSDGTLPNDYKGGTEFTDVEGGTYKITISTTSDEKERKIVGVGRESSTNEMRSIEVIVAIFMIETAIFSPTLVLNGNADVHWGPIESTGDLTATGDLFPRKYAVGQIVNRTPDGVGDPDTDGIEYWAHFPVPDPPDIDFDHYYDNADEYYGPDVGHPNFMGGVPFNFNGHAQDNPAGADRIYYIEGDCTLKNTFLKGSVIIEGDCTLNGNGKGQYVTDVPEDAWEEYAKIDTAAVGEYPGDGGFQTCNATYDYADDNYKITVMGFVYIGGDWNGSGGQDFNGSVQCMGNMAGLTGNVGVWYNEDVAEQVEVSEQDFSQVSWREIKPVW